MKQQILYVIAKKVNSILILSNIQLLIPTQHIIHILLRITELSYYQTMMFTLTGLSVQWRCTIRAGSVIKVRCTRRQGQSRNIRVRNNVCYWQAVLGKWTLQTQSTLLAYILSSQLCSSTTTLWFRLFLLKICKYSYVNVRFFTCYKSNFFQTSTQPQATATKYRKSTVVIFHDLFTS